MSLVFESQASKDRPGDAATHALLIGCGDYPNLATAGYNLQALTSPSVSVKAMADWFLRGPDGCGPEIGAPPNQAFFNPDAPLGSVEILMSPAGEYVAPSGAKVDVERPTFAAIKAAYRRWLKRLSNAESRGVFYFCGHGVGDGVDQVLIADDFAEDPEDVWAPTFNVSNTCQTAIRKTGATLAFFIDACMEFNPDLVKLLDRRPGLLTTGIDAPALCSEWIVLRATTTNRLAYALPNDLARFTKALLQALQGHCGTQRAGGNFFDVTADQLRRATAGFLTLHQKPGDRKWQKIGTPHGEGSWNVPLHVLKTRPCAFVQIDVAPAGFRRAALAFMERDGQPRLNEALNDGPAQFRAEWGEWAYGVTPTVANAFNAQARSKLFIEPVCSDESFTIP